MSTENPWAGYDVPEDYEYTPDGPQPVPKPLGFLSRLLGRK